MSREEIDEHFKKAYDYENARDCEKALEEYRQGIAKLEVYIGEASEEERPGIEGL